MAEDASTLELKNMEVEVCPQCESEGPIGWLTECNVCGVKFCGMGHCPTLCLCDALRNQNRAA